ncbi:MAG: hypothetical protein ABIG30_03085 [Candidatus Aenigmatarchaeota archaeon]
MGKKFERLPDEPTPEARVISVLARYACSCDKGNGTVEIYVGRRTQDDFGMEPKIVCSLTDEFHCPVEHKIMDDYAKEAVAHAKAV